MNQNIKTQHDDVISLIRLMAMCMIITCHIMQYYDMGLAFWFNVGVQIFLCISGFLYGKREIQDAILFISSGFKKILKDYYIFIVICIIIYKIFYPELMPNRTVLGLFFGYGSTDGLGHLWFVSCILCCYFITPLLDKFEKKRLERGKEQKFLGGGYYGYLVIANIFLILGIEIFFHYYIHGITAVWVNCYIIGFLIGKYARRGYELRRIAKYLVPLGFIINVGKIYVQNSTCDSVKNSLLFSHYYSSYAHVFLGVAIFLAIYCSFEKRKYALKGVEPILRFSDKYSYDIYLVHLLFIMGPFNMEEVTSYQVLNILLILCCIILSGMLLYQIRIFLFDRDGRKYKKAERGEE